eukprot:765143-Hanusia_phi.AAC.5
MVLVRLSRETRDEGGPQHQPRDPLAQLLEKGDGVVAGRTVHGLEHGVADMLEGDVDVLADLVDARDGVDQLVAEVARVAVEQRDPAHLLYLSQRVEQICQPALVCRAEVLPPLVRVLCDQVELCHPRRHQLARLLHDGVEGLGAEAPAPARDRAEGALVIAPLCHAQEGRVLLRDPHSLPLRAEGNVGASYGDLGHGEAALGDDALNLVADVRVLLKPNHRVHLRQLVRQLLCVPLSHAARDDDSLRA